MLPEVASEASKGLDDPCRTLSRGYTYITIQHHIIHKGSCLMYIHIYIYTYIYLSISLSLTHALSLSRACARQLCSVISDKTKLYKAMCNFEPWTGPREWKCTGLAGPAKREGGNHDSQIACKMHTGGCKTLHKADSAAEPFLPALAMDPGWICLVRPVDP